jgi:hypothetical protein
MQIVRSRLYIGWCLPVCLASLVPALIYPDFLDVALRHRPMVAGDRIALPILAFLTDGPTRVAYAMGINIGTHQAQAWPEGWPPILAHSLKMSLIFVPFWFVLGVPILEVVLFWRRRLPGHRRGVGAEHARAADSLALPGVTRTGLGLSHRRAGDRELAGSGLSAWEITRHAGRRAPTLSSNNRPDANACRIAAGNPGLSPSRLSQFAQ